MALFHTILHPTDFDGPSREAFRVARALAQQLGARVIAFHIAAPPAVVREDGRVILDPKAPESGEQYPPTNSSRVVSGRRK